MIIFSINVVILSVIVPLIIALLVKVKCHIQRLAVILIISIVLVETSKALSDGLRAFENHIGQVTHMVIQTIILMAERIQCLILFLYVLSINEVRIKIAVKSLEEYKAEIIKHKALSKRVLIAFVCI